MSNICIILISLCQSPSGPDPLVVETADNPRGYEAVVKIQSKDKQKWGSGFVACEKHRLIATAGHIADNFRVNDTLLLQIEKKEIALTVAGIQYSPQTIRELDFGLRVYSANPKDGPIFYPETDVAILQFHESFPPGVIALSISGLSDQDQTAKVVGFPTEDSYVDPQPKPPNFWGLRVNEGHVARKSKKLTVSEGASKNIDYIESSMGFGAGGSGSPLFNKSNEVIGVFTGVSLNEETVEFDYFQYAIPSQLKYINADLIDCSSFCCFNTKSTLGRVDKDQEIWERWSTE